MQKNAALLVIVFMIMSLSFNYTFPLHRRKSDSSVIVYPNQTNAEVCEIPHNSQRNLIVDRSKKMANNVHSAFKRFRDTAQDFGKSIYDQLSSGLKQHINIISEDDLRQYEQMVIMKKYPYLDLKELEMKHSPSKNTRHNEDIQDGATMGYEPGIWEPMIEDMPNVEITNRGLSGFAIPPIFSKQYSNIVDNKASISSLNSNTNQDQEGSSKIKKSVDPDVLSSLHNDVKEYIEKITYK